MRRINSNINNIEIRTALEEYGVKKWQLAERLGILDSSLSRKLRNELPEEEKQKWLDIIRNFRKDGEADGTDYDLSEVPEDVLIAELKRRRWKNEENNLQK